MTVSIPPARLVAGCLEVDRPQGDLCRVAPWPDLGVRSVYPGLAVPAGVDADAYQRAGYVAALNSARRTYGGLDAT